MKKVIPNQYTGHQAAGYRFCFHVRAIAHRSLFLPLIMKDHPKIQRLIKGESPLTVFECQSIQTAREAFQEFRKKFDFAYWAIKEYCIHDLNDADNIIPLHLNTVQHYLIDILQKRYHNHLPSRYVITKSFPRCGLTTCIQAYILWLQTYQCKNNSYTCSSSDINLFPLKADLCRFLKREIVPTERWIYLPTADRRAFFNTYRSPHFIRGINLGYVHFADMSKWKDPEDSFASRAFHAATSAVLIEYFTLVVFEGNIPKEDCFRIERHQNFHLPYDFRIWQLQSYTNNPFFLDYLANAISQPSGSYLIHINLDHAIDSSLSINIPLLLQK